MDVPGTPAPVTPAAAARPGETSPDGPPALPRDAAETVERAAADEAAAAQARVRFRIGEVPSVEDDEVGPDLLEAGERLIAVRKRVALERREPPHTDGCGLSGTLYLTSNRLGLAGRNPVEFPIDGIRETALVGERVVVSLRTGQFVWIQCDAPRLLRVEIASARASVRAPRPRTQRPR